MPVHSLTHSCFGCQNEVNGIANSMATQMWIFGPGSKEPNKYPPENGYSVDNLEKWVRKGAAEFGIKLTKKPKVPTENDSLLLDLLLHLFGEASGCFELFRGCKLCTDQMSIQHTVQYWILTRRCLVGAGGDH